MLAAKAEAGYVFNGWSADTPIVFNKIDDMTVIFELPKNDTVVTAAFVPKTEDGNKEDGTNTDSSAGNDHDQSSDGNNNENSSGSGNSSNSNGSESSDSNNSGNGNGNCSEGSSDNSSAQADGHSKIDEQDDSQSTANLRTPISKITVRSGSKIKLPIIKIAAPKSLSQISYRSSNAKVAAVNSKGQVRAKSKGKAIITVSARVGTSIKIKIVVVPKAENPKKLAVAGLKTKYKKGQTAQLKLRIATPATNIKKVSFKSGNKKILTVDQSGEIIAKSKGKTTIAVKVGKASVRKTVRVD
jgi:hypothetical protein